MTTESQNTESQECTSSDDEISANTSKQWLIAFLVTPLLALLGVCVSLQIWNRDLSIPFEYAHDSFLVTVPVKTMVEHGWWYTNPNLGAPRAMEFHDYPSSPNMHIAILKFMALFDSNAFRLLNWYFLLSFPLIAVCTLAAFKTLRLAVVPSVALSLIFTMAPYHYWRGIAHLWLGCYFTVPLAMILIVWVAENRRGILFDLADKRGIRLSLKNPGTWAVIAICASLGFDFPYYPIFAAFLLLIVGPFAAVRLKSWLPVYRSTAMIGGIAMFFVLNLLPNLLYRVEHGKNQSPTLVTHRPWNHAEMYGLKIASLLMPAKNHPISKLDRVQEKYMSGTVAPSEGAAQSLGTVAAFGFIALIAWLLFKQNRGTSRTEHTMDLMSILNLASILLATVGGFSAAFNLVSMGALRGYNRISIFIMFFSLVAVAIWLGRQQLRFSQTTWQRRGYLALLCLVTVVCCYEQSRYFRMTGPTELAEYESDREFVEHISSTLGNDGHVFQYPVQNFLSHVGPAIRWDPYTHFRGYLHNKDLHWSFGAVTGRTGSQIQNWLNDQPTNEAINNLALMGFNGIYIDRKLYDDHGAEIEQQLSSILEQEPVVSANERLCFFDLQPFTSKLENSVASAELKRLQEAARNPVLVDWEKLDVEEVYPDARFRWCRGNEARLVFNNLSKTERKIEVQFNLATATGESANLKIEGLGLNENLTINGEPTPVSKSLTLPPGLNYIEFQSDAKALVTPVRNVTFKVCEFKHDADQELRLALQNLVETR